MSAPSVPATGAAGWILAAGGAVSLHLVALALLGLVLAAPPEAPSEAPGGIVIRTIPQVTATAPRAGRPRAAPLGASGAMPAALPERLEPTAQTTPALTPDSPRLAAMASRPGEANRPEIPRSGASPQEVAPDRQPAPRRIGATAAPRRLAATDQGRSAAASEAAPRRVAPGGQGARADRSEAARRVAPAMEDRAAALRPSPPRRAAPISSPERLEPTAQTTALLPPDSPRLAAMASRPGEANRPEIPRSGTSPQEVAPDRQPAPRRVAPGGQGARADRSEAARRVAPAMEDRAAALRPSPPRRAAPVSSPERLGPEAQTTALLPPDNSRRAAIAERSELSRSGTSPQEIAPDRQAAPRRVGAMAEARRAAETTAPRRVAATGQGARPDAARLRARPAAPDSPRSAPAEPGRLAATGAREAARLAPATARARPLSAALPAPAESALSGAGLQDAGAQDAARRTIRPPAPAPAAAVPPPRDPAPRRSRARRDGPDRRLSDRPAAPLRDPDAVTLERMRALLADLHGVPCHMVLPLPEGLSGFAALGTDRARLAAAGPRLDAALGVRPVLATHPVTADQCPAIDFAAGSRDDPRRGLALDLWRSVASAGQPLTGTLLHDGAGALHLLLIDTAGQVHDLTGFLQPVPGGSHFTIPMSGGDLPGDARQLLLAVATPSPLSTLPPRAAPAAAGPLLEALGAELARLGLVPDLALAAFVFD